MEQNKKSFKSSLRKANSVVHMLKNLYDKASDGEFREFEIMEYGNIESGEVSDLKRLNYLKKLQLAKNGYVDAEIKNRVAQQKQKQHLIDKDAKILPIGHIKFIDGELFRAQLQLGYESEQKAFKVAYENHENIPKWKELDMDEFVLFTSRIHPNESDNLRLEHTYCGSDSRCLQNSENLKQVRQIYNHCVSKAFHGNKYFTNSILRPDENLLENPELYMGKQFHLKMPGKNVSIVTLSEANGHYLSFRSFLEAAPTPETHYFTKGEFKRLFLDSQIEVIALLKYDLRLGMKDGILHIGRDSHNPPQPSMEWDTYDSIIKTSELPVRVKYYLCKEIIMNKNFVVEKDAVRLESQGRTAFLKKHYKTGKWHFAEILKSSEELHYRPMTPDVSKYIRQTYSDSKDFDSIEKQIIKNKNRRIGYQMQH